MVERPRLTPEQTTALNNARRILHDLTPAIEDLSKCGHNCDMLKQQRDETLKGLDAIAHYFGNQGPYQ